jgi:hypothetical protein
MKKQCKRIRLEPELEEEMGEASAAECRRLARKLARWIRQLKVKAKIIEMDEAPKPKAELRPLHPSKLKKN